MTASSQRTERKLKTSSLSPKIRNSTKHFKKAAIAIAELRQHDKNENMIKQKHDKETELIDTNLDQLSRAEN